MVLGLSSTYVSTTMCFPPNYKNIVLNTSSLVACLKKLAFGAYKEMYQRKAVEYMKEKEVANFQEDKKLRILFDEK